MLLREFLFSSLFLLSHLLPSVYSSFTYEFGVPGSCDDLEVSWTGGQAPFQLLLVPVFDPPRTFDIPNSAVDNGKGRYNISINFPVGQKIFLVMSDATGFASGGVSLVTQVGPSTSGKNCNTTSPSPDFLFNLDSALTQCRTYSFSDYRNATQPVTITGFIPGGTTFQIQPPTGPTSYDWKANLEAGTTAVFVMTDSKGRNGGSSDVKLVGASGDNSCLGSSHPASTSNPPTATSSTGPSATESSGQGGGRGGPSAVVLALASLGGVLALALVAFLLFVYFRRKKREDAYSGGAYLYGGKRGSRRMSLDLEEPRPIDNTDDGQIVSHITPFSNIQSATSSDHLRHSREDLQDVNPASSHSGHTSPNPRSKASQVSSPRQPRFVVHTDVEDAVPEDDGQEVIELPPAYSGRRAQVPVSAAGSSLHTDDQASPPSLQGPSGLR